VWVAGSVIAIALPKNQARNVVVVGGHAPPSCLLNLALVLGRGDKSALWKQGRIFGVGPASDDLEEERGECRGQ
jgi:hypothetical protein